jgi:hypothetical protein
VLDRRPAPTDLMVQALRLLWPDPDSTLATKSAISQASCRLGARPVVALFHQVCQPLARAQTPGTFLFGLRLMALDGTVEDVPETSANARTFYVHRQHRYCCIMGL